YQSGHKSIKDMLAFGPRSIQCALSIVAMILRRKVDLVYINGPRCLLAGALAARITGRPSLFYLHNTLGRKSDIAVASWAANHVSRIVACSHAVASPLLRANPLLARKTQVLYPPVESLPAGRCRPGWRMPRNSGQFVIGMVGRITKGKGQHVLLGAVAALKNSRGVKIVFVGAPEPGNKEDAAYLHSLRSSVSEWGLDDATQWTGYQPDLDRYYAAMDALVVPSICEEGLSLVVMEAFQRGIPVVASNIGGIPELIRHEVNGVLVPPGSPGDLAKALGRLQHNPDLCRKLGSAALASIDERFSKKLYCKAIGTLMSEIYARRSPSEFIHFERLPVEDIGTTSVAK
ncbi:MAG: glycosyltransferase family 4 protein, partial [Terriglobia bacterium]